MFSNCIKSLIHANQGIIRQKIALLDLLETQYGPQTCAELFTKTCPIVKATIGQHYRHSTDHMELPILMVHSGIQDGEIHYDLRVRGGTLEKDIGEARKRLISIQEILKDIDVQHPKEHEQKKNLTDHEKVDTYFMLSGDTNLECKLQSTLGRELGFAAHHAIHHMAMVKIIAIQTLGVKEIDLPADFGMAPSTVNYFHQ
jgi:hypothetical protein